MAEYDAAFDGLSASLRRKIDRAFDKAAGIAPGTTLGPTGVSARDDDATQAGGFLLDDDAGGFLPPSPPAGGFVPASPPTVSHDAASTEPSADDLIPLSEIPHALQLLDLSPSDEEILSVFRNAATGWGKRGQSSSTGEAEEFVSRKDWRAVCSVVLGSDDDDEAGEEPNGGDAEDRSEGHAINDEDSDEDVMDVDDDFSGDGSSDEYVEEKPKGTKRARTTRAQPARKTRAQKAKNTSSGSEDAVDIGDRPLTARQKRECLAAFCLFFPGMPEETVAHRRIGVKELTKAADLLKEKLKVEEMMEMLDAFSSTPDKTMGLVDFEKMMVATRMA